MLAVCGVVAVLWELRTKDPDRRRPLREAAGQARRESDGRRRILVVANETLCGDELRAELAGREDRVLRVVAPVLPSRSHYVASDIDRELREARARLDDTLRLGGRAAVSRPPGRVSDMPPLPSIEDELRGFAADELLISTHPPQRSRWLESGLVERAREELEIPVTHVVVDLGAAPGPRSSPCGPSRLRRAGRAPRARSVHAFRARPRRDRRGRRAARRRRGLAAQQALEGVGGER